jgi:hypothetical protein
MFEETISMGLEEPFDPLAQRRIVAARLVEIGGPFGSFVLCQRREENGLFAHGGFSG